MSSSRSSPLRFASALSTEPDPLAAARQACELVKERLGAVPDLVVLFVSAKHTAAADALAPLVCDCLELKT